MSPIVHAKIRIWNLSWKPFNALYVITHINNYNNHGPDPQIIFSQSSYIMLKKFLKYALQLVSYDHAPKSAGMGGTEEATISWLTFEDRGTEPTITGVLK